MRSCNFMLLGCQFGGAETVRGASRFQSLVINNRVPVRTMQSLDFTVTVLALKNAVHP